MKQGAPACGLYLRIDGDPDMQQAITALRQAGMVINRSEYERNMHVVELQAGEGEARDKAAALAELAKLQGMTSIVRGDAGTAQLIGADGVLLRAPDEISAARALLGEAAIIGVSCGLDRSMAQRMKEAGVDFVGFGLADQKILPPHDLIGWWSTLSDIPALAEGPVDNDSTGVLVRAGASFLDCWAYIAGHPKGVLQGTVNMLYAVDLALETVKLN